VEGRGERGLIRVAEPYDAFVTFRGYTPPKNATPAAARNWTGGPRAAFVNHG